jgi:hypothetical protein
MLTSEVGRRFAIGVSQVAHVVTTIIVCIVLATLLVGCASSGTPTKSLEQWDADYKRTLSRP